MPIGNHLLRALRLLPLPLALAVSATALGVGCRSGGEDVGLRAAAVNSLVLRSYDVPTGSARAVVATLTDTFWIGENEKRVGRAAVTPDGHLLVLAPPNVQDGVQPLIDELAKHPPSLEQTIELYYFVVLGKPAAAPQPPPPGVSDIQPALDEIVKSQGPQTFTVMQRARLSTLNGTDGKVEADKLKIWQKAAATNDGVDAQVNIDFPGSGKVESRVHLVADRIVVLGSTAQHTDASEGTLYYVVRAAPHAGGKQP
jgi:hypothetical protein